MASDKLLSTCFFLVLCHSKCRIDQWLMFSSFSESLHCAISQITNNFFSPLEKKLQQMQLQFIYWVCKWSYVLKLMCLTFNFFSILLYVWERIKSNIFPFLFIGIHESFVGLDFHLAILTRSLLYRFFPLCPDKIGLLSSSELVPFEYSLECFLYCHQPFLCQVCHPALISAALKGSLWFHSPASVLAQQLSKKEKKSDLTLK